MSDTLTSKDRLILHSSAELAGLANCLLRECRESEAGPEDFRLHLAQALRRISRTLWDQVGDRDE